MSEGQSEASMEDILSSIKRIIADEGEQAVSRGRRAVAPAPTPAVDDVLELAEPLEPVATEALVSPDTRAATRKPLEALSSLKLTPEQPGSDTLEGLVRELLRPLLAEWLDRHLPELVERMVAIEIARVTGRS